jgi:dsDNA-binding SOS-regulon protein
MFDNKKEAEAHDKMLELAESITGLLNRNIADMDEGISREVGLLLAKRSDDLAKAIKGKPEALLSEPSEPETTEDSNVSPLTSAQ